MFEFQSPVTSNFSNSLLVEVEHHQPYAPTMPSFTYTINFDFIEKAKYLHRECILKPRYPYSTVDIDHMDDDIYLFNQPTTTKSPQNLQQVRTN